MMDNVIAFPRPAPAAVVNPPCPIIPCDSAANQRVMVERAAVLSRSSIAAAAAIGMRNLRHFRDFSQFHAIRLYAGMALADVESFPEGEY